MGASIGTRRTPTSLPIRQSCLPSKHQSNKISSVPVHMEPSKSTPLPADAKIQYLVDVSRCSSMIGLQHARYNWLGLGATVYGFSLPVEWKYLD